MFTKRKPGILKHGDAIPWTAVGFPSCEATGSMRHIAQNRAKNEKNKDFSTIVLYT